MILLVTDLNRGSKVCDPARESIAGAANVRGQAGVCASHGAFAAAHLSTNREPLCGRTKGEVVLVPGSIPVHGLRTIDLSREPARHRSVSARAALQALSPWDSVDGRTEYVGQCKRGARLAYLRRFCAGPDRHRAAAVCRRALWCRFEGVGLRAGYHDHRSVPVGVFVGTFSLDQG